MGMQASITKSYQPEVIEHDLTLLGVGAGVPTVSNPTGPTGITVTRTSAGVYKLTWSDNPGRILGAYFNFRATTPGDLKTFSIVREAYSSTTRAFQFTLYNASGTATDLQALQWIEIHIRFKTTAA